MKGAVAGIDAGKSKLDVHLDGKDWILPNDRDGFRAIAKWFRDAEVERVVLKATGRMHRALVQSLHSKGFAVSVVNPRQSRDFAKATGQLAKTDRVDARMLAAFGAAFANLPQTQPRGVFLDRLGDMLVASEKVVDQRALLKATQSEVDDPVSAKELPALIAGKDRAIAAYDRGIEALIADHAESCRILQSIPGIGPVTAAALICWMSELGTIGNRQAAALIGVVPMARDSGTLKGARRIRGGRRRPRDVLCMAAMAAMVWNPEMKATYERLRASGKCHKVALVAVMRRLIVLANVLLRDRRTWTERAPA